MIDLARGRYSPRPPTVEHRVPLEDRFAEIINDRERAILVAIDDASTEVVGFAAVRDDDLATIVHTPVLHVSHLIVAPMLFFPIVWEANPLYVLPIVLSAITIVTLLALPRIKGGWIGLMYALQVTSRDETLHTADAAD